MQFKTRLTLAFGLFIFVLCVLFAALLFESLTELEDHLVETFLAQEAEYLRTRYQQDPIQAVVPDLEQLKGYYSHARNLPEWLSALQPGYHQTEEYHVLVSNIDKDLLLYLVYDEARGVLDREETTLLLFIGLLILVVLAIGLILARYQANLLAKPINDLANQVDRVNTSNPEIEPLHRNDEIGRLSRAYSDLISRLRQFIEREQAFTRYASHELMTPLSIMRNNLELIQHEPGNTEMRQRAIARSLEANQRMQQQIEIFLMLAREERMQSTAQAIDWQQLLNELKTRFTTMDLHVEISDANEVHVNELVTRTILENIFSNIGRHGRQQNGHTEAWLKIDAAGLEVSNRCSESKNPDSGGYGFGLEINRKLCRAVGWRFDTSEQDGRFRAYVDFSQTLD